MMQVLTVAFVLAAIGGTDMLLVHGVVGVYPIAWLPATIACGITLHLELRTDLLRPRGFDRSVLYELAGFVAAAALVGAVAFALQGAAPVAVAALASAGWMVVIAIMWGVGRRRPPPRVFGERALARFVAGLTDLDDDRPIARGLAALWQQVAITVRAAWRAEPGGSPGLRDIATGAVWQLDPEVAGWLVAHPEPLAVADLATMRLGPLRPRVEAMVAARGASLFVPLVDRGALVGVVEADHVRALREAERGLVAESARAGARALTYVQLARIAAREGATAREVEVAEAMRLQASASRDDELGPWLVTAEYRSAARTTSAAWSASLLDDGRLALVVTEGQAHGVVAALATAALTGAFTAATTATQPTLEALVATLGASAEGVLRGGAPIAAFVAILDSEARTLAWSCAGHPGAYLIASGAAGGDGAGSAPRALGGGGARLGDPGGAVVRGEAPFGPDTLLVVASRALRGPDANAWYGALGAQAAAGPRLAAALVEAAANRGPPGEDLLAVVVRQRRGDRRSATLSR